MARAVAFICRAIAVFSNAVPAPGAFGSPENQADSVILFGHFRDDARRTVRRIVVDHDDLPRTIQHRHDLVDERTDHTRFVVGR